MKDHTTPKYEEIDPVTKDKFVAHHEFDGIRELDNKPPYWLSIIFVVSVLVAYAYIAKYHIFKTGDLQIEQYQKEMAKYNTEDEAESLMGLMSANKEIELIALSDDVSLNSGKEIYKSNCAVCHLNQGQGSVGPNLTDEYWINGGGYADIVKTVKEGVPAKGMISWRSQISSQQIHEVSSYILTLIGTNPPDPKAPQGEKYEPSE